MPLQTEKDLENKRPITSNGNFGLAFSVETYRAIINDLNAAMAADAGLPTTLVTDNNTGGTDIAVTEDDKIIFNTLSSIYHDNINKTIFDNGGDLLSFEGTGDVQWLNSSTSLGLGESPSTIERFRTTIGTGTYTSGHRIDVSHDSTGTWNGVQIRSTTPKTKSSSTTIGVHSLLTGTASAGTHTYVGGKFNVSGGSNNYAVQLLDGSEGTAGHVWTSQGTLGEGNWAAPSGGTLTSTLTAGDTTADGQVIKALNGGGQLTLRSGTDSLVTLTTDNDGQVESGVYMDPNSLELFSQSWNCGMSFNTTETLVYSNGGTEVQQKIRMQVDDSFPIILWDNTTTNRTSTNVDNKSLFLGTNNSTTNSGVYNSPIIGGTGLTATKSNTVYMPDMNAVLPTYADDSAAGVGGLTTGDFYMTATGEVRIKV
jgi:hypothetical protein